MTLDTKKNELSQWLQTAFELEWGTIPPYMMALLSIHQRRNRVAADLIRSVMIEEMLHMMLVGNLMSSLEQKIVIGPGNVPAFPLSLTFQGKRFKDRQFDIDLMPFSPGAIETFLKIELPSDWAAHQQRAIAAVEIPGLTLGDFYGKILKSLEELCRAHGEKAVFRGDPSLQINLDYYWSSGGTPVVIHDLATAKKALKIIIEQGEGTRVSIYDDKPGVSGHQSELAHFYRFREILFGRFYRPGDKPRENPTGDPFEVDYSAAYPIKKNPKSKDYVAGSRLAELNDTFNRNYTLMLIQFSRAFNGAPKTMYTAIMNGMHGLTSIAGQMVTIPIEGDPQGLHGAPSFEWLEPVVVE